MNLKGKLNNRGITLIALVITIIVLLILAGVSIAMLTGENGILTQAQKSQTQTDIGKEKEDIALAYNGAKAEKNGKNVDADDLNRNFGYNDTNAIAEDIGTDEITVTFTDSRRVYTIDADGNISEPTESNIVASMRIEGTKLEPTTPIGFTHTEGTVDDGYVIEDTSGNEFVWVPVDKDQMIKINVTSKEDITSIILTDPYGDEILKESDVGMNYSKEQTPTINGSYILKVSTASEEKKTILGIHSLYAIDTESDWQATDEYAQAQGYDTFQELLGDRGYATKENFLMDGSWIKDFSELGDDYSESVNENGGFYIGRYEASYEDGKPASKESTVANTSLTLENGKLWNNITQTDALSYANSMYKNEEFTSSLLTGAAWDRTLGWLEETRAVTSFEIVVDSKTWGNYNDDIFSSTTDLANTGQFSQTEKNHIFDLAGNLWEWTTETNSIDNKVSRAGSYFDSGSSVPCRWRNSGKDGTSINFGFRLALYL